MEIKDHHGFLVIAEDWSPEQSMPRMARALWPTGLPTIDFSHLIGLPVRKYAGGYMVGSGLSEFMVMPLADNTGKVYASGYETKPIKKPRWAITYQNGSWKR